LNKNNIENTNSIGKQRTNNNNNNNNNNAKNKKQKSNKKNNNNNNNNNNTTTTTTTTTTSAIDKNTPEERAKGMLPVVHCFSFLFILFCFSQFAIDVAICKAVPNV
jgi:hypothetical protein